MRTATRALALLLALLLGWPAFAQSITTTQPAPGQYPGTTTNDSAAAGNVGEFTSLKSNATATATVTFSNGSADITWTAHGLVVGNLVSFATTGGLPTNFAINTNYYIIATNLQTNSFEVSATPGGSAITAGSAGTGTQTGQKFQVLATATSQDIVFLQLTAGDWDVSGVVEFVPAASTNSTILAASINTTSNSVPGPNNGQTGYLGSPAQVTVQVTGLVTPMVRVSVANGATQNVYLGAAATFTVSTMTAGGFIRARRVR